MKTIFALCLLSTGITFAGKNHDTFYNELIYNSCIQTFGKDMTKEIYRKAEQQKMPSYLSNFLAQKFNATDKNQILVHEDTCKILYSSLDAQESL